MCCQCFYSAVMANLKLDYGVNNRQVSWREDSHIEGTWVIVVPFRGQKAVCCSYGVQPQRSIARAFAVPSTALS